MKNYITNLRPNLLFALTVSFFASCVTIAKLIPVTSTKEAISEANGVRLIFQTSAWIGEHDIKQEVTPIKLKIENNSGKKSSISD